MSEFADVVILLPGITGSVLANTAGNEVWAPNAGAVWRSIVSGGNSLTILELQEPADDDGVRATRLVPDATLVPGLVKIDGYTRIQEQLISRLGLTSGQNFHTFPYDWRRDNRHIARLFKAFATDKLNKWRDNSKNSHARLVLIGHSMGGLVARYFVECLEGWRDTRLLFTLGTPHRGSLKAAGFLTNGMKKGIGPWGIDLSPLLRSCPSVYQLLPTYPCVIDGSRTLRMHEAAAAGLLPRIDEDRAQAAYAFHQQLLAAQQKNDKDEQYRQSGYKLVPIVGIDQPTAQSFIVGNGEHTLANNLHGEDLSGDGTVPRASAVPINMETNSIECYSAEMHGALQNNDAVFANMFGIITKGEINWRRYLRADDRTPVTLEVDDIVLPGAPLTVRARGAEGQVRLQVDFKSLRGASFTEDLRRDGNTDWQRGEFALDAGVWRITVNGENAAPVSDLVVIATK